MTPRTKKTAAALGGALVLASGAYGLGSQAGGGSALAGSTTPSPQAAPPGPGPGRFGGPRDLSAIAGRLGVTEDKLRAALQDLRPDRAAAKDDRRNELAKALAGELGLSSDKVQAALEKFKGERKVGRRERRGDRLQRFDDALATKLGVDPAKVRSAFDALRSGGRRGGPPDLADLAGKIGVSEDKLRSALADLRPGPGGGPGPGRLGRFGPGKPGPGKLAPGGRRHPGGPAVAALAKELGVTQAKLTAAMEKVRGQFAPKRQAEQDAFVTKLAAKLGVPEAKVKQVIGAGPHHGRRGP
jgi:hypothetical protein